MDERPISSVLLDESPAFLRFLSDDQMQNNIGHDSISSGDLIVSTYQLSKENPSCRTGSILLLSSAKNASVKRKIVTNGGVFRFEIIPESGKVLAALTSGRVSIVDVKADSQQSSGIISGGIILNAAWNKATKKTICSDDYGELMLVDAEKFEVDERWIGHKSKYGLAVCEIWCCCWLGGENTCASGAEDGKVKIWDVRADPTHPQAVNAESHSAGVTFVGPVVGGGGEGVGHQVLTGSYDEHFRVFDVRKFDEPLEEHQLNGGVWHVERMAVNDDGEQLYLTSCMYGGWSVVSKSAASRLATVHVGKDLMSGESLLYGVSSRRLADGKYRMASCTFNDKCVRICEVVTNVHHRH